VLTIILAAKTKHASTYDGYLAPAAILRTLEHAYGLGYLGDAGNSALAVLPIQSNSQASGFAQG
jgi:hypothetical protein